MSYVISGGSGQPDALSVSAALGVVKGSLENIRMKIVGEVSELTDKSGYKAVYFTIKDEKSTLKCLIWKNVYAQVGVTLSLGALVELTGRFSLNPKKGTMSFNVTGIELAGEGYLRMQVANLARKLQAEGLMDPSRKLALPAYPERIGLVTSPRGAAVHDVLRTLRRHYPLGRVLLAGVAVEGPKAVDFIIEGMRAVVRSGAQIVLLVRGGGAYEDFMPFNDERLARAIVACPVPVVTGIGHEPDNSIADMVADIRHSTPTGAAEGVVPSVANIKLRLDACKASLDGSVAGSLSVHRQRIASAGSVMSSALKSRLGSSRLRVERIALSPLFADPKRLLEDDAQLLDALSARLSTALPRAIERDRQALLRTEDFFKRSLPACCAPEEQRISGFKTRLMVSLPRACSAQEQQVFALKGRLVSKLSHALERYEGPLRSSETRFRYLGDTLTHGFARDVAVGAARLHNLSPLTILARGYAVLENERDDVVKSVDDVRVEDKVKVMVSDGVVEARVESTRKIDVSVESWRNCDE